MTWHVPSIRRPKPPSRVVAGIALTFVASFCFAMAGFIASRLIGDEVRGTTIALLEASFGVVFVFGLRMGMQARLPRARRGERIWSRAAVLWLTLAAAFTALGFGAFYSSLNYELLSVVSPITGSVPLVSFALILLLLRGEERLTRRVVLGAVLVVIGVVIIGLNNS